MTRNDTPTIKNHAAFIWSVADLLRGDYKQSEYGKVILPLTVLRRLDCVLEPTKAEVLDAGRSADAARSTNIGPGAAARSPGQQFLQHVARSTFRRLLDDPASIAGNLRAYIAGFSAGARDVLEKFEFDDADRPARRGQPALPGRVASSPRSTCTPTPCPTWRWATSSRS